MTCDSQILKIKMIRAALIVLVALSLLLVYLLYLWTLDQRPHGFKTFPLTIPAYNYLDTSAGRTSGAFQWNINDTFFNVSAGQFMPLHTWGNTSLEDKRNLTVLIYNPARWERLQYWESGMTDSHCPLQCHFTFNESKLSTADGVIFYAINMPKLKELPLRPPGQVWLYYVLESPIHTSGQAFDDDLWRDQINWTLTYRRDSDIWFPYRRFYKRPSPYNIANLTQQIAKKTKMVAWVVSNCFAPSRRDSYVRELQEYISVDIYGGCGPLKCGDKCFDVLSQDYKFYLAFENSLCADYITEKAYQYMESSDVVVITRGAANYSQILPPGSYISTSDFRSPKLLAEYLHFLDRNPQIYLRYFEWKNLLIVKSIVPSCEICARLLQPELYENRYSNVWRWWIDGQCHNPNDLRS